MGVVCEVVEGEVGMVRVLKETEKSVTRKMRGTMPERDTGSPTMKPCKLR